MQRAFGRLRLRRRRFAGLRALRRPSPLRRGRGGLGRGLRRGFLGFASPSWSCAWPRAPAFPCSSSCWRASSACALRASSSRAASSCGDSSDGAAAGAEPAGRGGGRRDVARPRRRGGGGGFLDGGRGGAASSSRFTNTRFLRTSTWIVRALPVESGGLDLGRLLARQRDLLLRLARGAVLLAQVVEQLASCPARSACRLPSCRRRRPWRAAPAARRPASSARSRIVRSSSAPCASPARVARALASVLRAARRAAGAASAGSARTSARAPS